MPLSPELRSELITATHEAACAFVEDMRHVREILARDETSVAEIRRLSVVLRRILLDGEISMIAAPRIGKLMLRAPDNNPVYKDRLGPPLFFLSGRVRVFGWSGAILAREAKPGDIFSFALDEDRTVDLRLDSFLAQRVLCYRGQWVSRKAVIKYIANFASGAHTSSPKDDETRLLAAMRKSNRLVLSDGGIHLELLNSGLNSDDGVFRYSPDCIDPVLIETLATSRFISISPDVEKLEEAISLELLEPAP